MNELTLQRRVRMIWLAGGLALFVFAWYGSLVPLHFVPRALADAWQQFAASPIDWQNGSKLDWGVNALLLVPGGFCLLGAAWRAEAGWGERVLRTLAVAAGCLLVSALIEFSQSWFPSRVPSRADVAAQFLGAAAGLAGWWLCGGLFNRALADYLSDKRATSALDLALIAYVVGLLLFSLAPLDIAIHPSELMRKYRDGRISLAPFSFTGASPSGVLYDILSDVLVFIPVGLFAATFPRRRDGSNPPLAASLCFGGTVVLGIEVLQLFVMSRFSDVTDLFTGMAGVTVGVFAYRHLRGRAAEPATLTGRASVGLLAAAATYCLLVLAILWSPYDFSLSDTALIRQRLSDFVGLPFSRALEGDYFSALNGFLQKFVLFVPLGGWIAVYTARLRPAYRSVAGLAMFLLTALFALGIELGQILLPSRFASFDDALVCAFGSLAGLLVAGRVGAVRRTKARQEAVVEKLASGSASAAKAKTESVRPSTG